MVQDGSKERSRSLLFVYPHTAGVSIESKPNDSDCAVIIHFQVLTNTRMIHGGKHDTLDLHTHPRPGVDA